MAICGRCPAIIEDTRWHRKLKRWSRLRFRCALSGRYVDPGQECDASTSDLRRMVAHAQETIDGRSGAE